jgi:hypothetical protein
MKWLFLIPLLTGFIDYLENIFIALSVASYPATNALTVSLASISTQIKMVFNLFFVLSLLLTLGTWLWTFFKKK